MTRFSLNWPVMASPPPDQGQGLSALPDDPAQLRRPAPEHVQPPYGGGQPVQRGLGVLFLLQEARLLFDALLAGEQPEVFFVDALITPSMVLCSSARLSRFTLTYSTRASNLMRTASAFTLRGSSSSSSSSRPRSSVLSASSLIGRTRTRRCWPGAPPQSRRPDRLSSPGRDHHSRTCSVPRRHGTILWTSRHGIVRQVQPVDPYGAVDEVLQVLRLQLDDRVGSPCWIIPAIIICS